jgi:hypothetical protein
MTRNQINRELVYLYQFQENQNALKIILDETQPVIKKHLIANYFHNFPGLPIDIDDLHLELNIELSRAIANYDLSLKNSYSVFN